MKITLFVLLLTVNKRNLMFEKGRSDIGAVAPLSGYKRQRLYMNGVYQRDCWVALHGFFIRNLA